MLVTHATFQPPMGWLNAEAPLRIERMLATLATFQEPMSWLKVVA